MATLVARGGSGAALHPCDPSEPADAQALIDFAIEKFGRIDILYNNAAAVHFASIEDMTHEMWRATMKGELDIVFNACKAAWPHLKRQGARLSIAAPCRAKSRTRSCQRSHMRPARAA